MQKTLTQEIEQLCLGIIEGLRVADKLESKLDEQELTKAFHAATEAYAHLLSAANKDEQTRLLLAKYTTNCKLNVGELRVLMTPVLELMNTLSDQGLQLDSRCSHQEPDGSSALIDGSPITPCAKRCVGCGKRL